MTEGAPMTPEDVPDDLLDLAKQGWDRHAATAPPGTYTHEGIRRAILAAVLPAHERQVREQVAAEILETIDADVPGDYEAGLERAARVARQEPGA